MMDYGRKIGLAFQIADDILDIEGDSERMGKSIGGDMEKKKATFPLVVGIEKAKTMQKEIVEQAVQALKPFDHRAEPLRQIAVYVIERKK